MDAWPLTPLVGLSECNIPPGINWLWDLLSSHYLQNWLGVDFQGFSNKTHCNVDSELSDVVSVQFNTARGQKSNPNLLCCKTSFSSFQDPMRFLPLRGGMSQHRSQNLLSFLSLLNVPACLSSPVFFFFSFYFISWIRPFVHFWSKNRYLAGL